MDNTTVELAAVIARAWLDEEFKEQLKEEKGDHEVFKDSGVAYNDSILSMIEDGCPDIEEMIKIDKCGRTNRETCTSSRLALRTYSTGDTDNYDISVSNADIYKTCVNDENRIIVTPKKGNRLIILFNDWDKFNNKKS